MAPSATRLSPTPIVAAQLLHHPRQHPRPGAPALRDAPAPSHDRPPPPPQQPPSSPSPPHARDGRCSWSATAASHSPMTAITSTYAAQYHATTPDPTPPPPAHLAPAPINPPPAGRIAGPDAISPGAPRACASARPRAPPLLPGPRVRDGADRRLHPRPSPHTTTASWQRSVACAPAAASYTFSPISIIVSIGISVLDATW